MWLADSSAWVNYTNDIRSPETALLHTWVGEKSVAMADLVLVEVMQGVGEEHRAARLLAGFRLLPQVQVGGEAIAVAAAANYRELRRRGITVRSTTDCLIATYCIVNEIELLHSDFDFDPFEEYLGLRVVRA